MKKIVSALIALCLVCAAASAQPRAIGVRIGGAAELSYQHSFGNNFLEADLGLGYLGLGGVFVSGIYDFIIASPGNFNIYVGPGLQLGVAQNENGANFGLAVAGQLGAEYQFGIPLNLSLDWRPAWHFLGNTGFGWGNFALGVKYRF